jgi:hypothetical protein
VSLTHTEPRDGSDVEIPENARMYHLTGAPHMLRAMDDPDWSGQLTPNAISAIPFRRAILVLRDRWATHGTPPPPSLLPKTADSTLVTAEEVLARYPRIPGVNLPKGPSRLPRYNYGPDFDRHGIMSVFPPQPFPGQEYPLRVPQIDADGDTIAGLRYPDSAVPLGTYNGWSLRKAGFAEGEQWWNTGSFGRRPLHRRGTAEEPVRRFRPAWPTGSGRCLHRPLGAAPGCCARLVAPASLAGCCVQLIAPLYFAGVSGMFFTNH